MPPFLVRTVIGSYGTWWALPAYGNRYVTRTEAGTHEPTKRTLSVKTCRININKDIHSQCVYGRMYGRIANAYVNIWTTHRTAAANRTVGENFSIEICAHMRSLNVLLLLQTWASAALWCLIRIGEGGESEQVGEVRRQVAGVPQTCAFLGHKPVIAKDPCFRGINIQHRIT